MADLTFLEILKEIREKLPAIVETSNLFDADIIARLESLADLNIDEIMEDLKKGSYLGNRKTDINLALNMTGITEELIRLSPDEAEAIWTDDTKTVQYDSATVTFVDGEEIVIPFTFDGNLITVSTHGDLLIQLGQSTAFTNKLEDTLISGFASGVTGEIIRIYDTVGANSNIERITLNAVSGAYKEKNPIYYWLKTTSAFQTIAMRSGDIIALTTSLPKLQLLANSIEQVLEIQSRLPQLIDTFDSNGNPNGDVTIYNNLTKLISIYSNLTALIAVYNDIKTGGTNFINTVANTTYKAKIEALADSVYKTKIETVAESIYKAKIETVADSTYKTKIETVADSTYKGKVETLADSTYKTKIEAIITNLTAVQNASDNALLAKQKAEEAKTKADSIMALQGNQVVNILVNGSPATIEYSAITGKFTFNIPEGKQGERGEAFTVNAIGTFAQRTLYDNQIAGFSFLALDVDVDGSTIPHIYFKKTATSGDWSTGIPFGRGEKGDTGISIVSIQFVSTTDASGLEGVSGAIDTYRFLLSDGTYTNTFVKYNGADIQLVNDLTTQDDTKALTAYQGFILKGMIDNINTLIASDDTTLDQLQEIVDYIKLNRADLEALNVNSIIGLVDALASKVDSTNLKTIDNQSILGTGNIEVVARKTVLGIAKFVSNDYYIKLKKYIDEQINKLKTKSYSFKWEIVSINANTQLELYVANKDIAKNDGIVFTNLSAGALIVSTVAKAGGVTINLYNPTASAISFSNTLLNTDIKYLIIKGDKK